jgi:hypothetical protein
MFEGLKSLFGGGNTQTVAAMLGPMLPGMLKQAKPALIEAYQQKALELENELDYELDENQEIVPFPVIRNGEIRINWVVLDHQDDDVIVIQDTIDTITLDELFAAATEQAPAQMELPEPTEPAAEPQTMLERAGVDTERYNQYFHERYVVIKIGNSYEVIEGPAAEGDIVYYGHQDETIAENWADQENRKQNV